MPDAPDRLRLSLPRTAATRGHAGSGDTEADRVRLDSLPPRIRRMLEIIAANQAAIVEPGRGTLMLHFRGGHVAAKLYVDPKPLHDDPPKTA